MNSSINSPMLSSGNLVGGMLLISSSCIGAGMLALPILTGLAGFFPSLAMLFIAWIFMTFTGLLLVEASGWFRGQTNLLSMAQKSLGPSWRFIGWLTYLFLFYSLLAAYISASGSVFSTILENLFHIHFSSRIVSLFFTLIFGWVIYLGTRPVDLLNRVLMGGLIFAYAIVIILGISQIHPAFLLQGSPKYLLSSLPVLIISFGFQNLIPSLVAYTRGDLKRVRLMILGGSAITFLVYLAWVLFVLGVVPYTEIFASYQRGEEATIVLGKILGTTIITVFAQVFALVTFCHSFLPQGLTLTHFLTDGFQLTATRINSRWMVFLALIPPLIFALSDPQIFFEALNFAGGICAMILFGVLPTLMIWVGRYRKKISSHYQVKGGKPPLVLAFCFSIFIMGCELVRIFK